MAVRKWKGKLLLFCLLCGVLYFIEQRYSFFRLRELEITPVGVLPDSLIWQAVPERSEGFWLSLFFGGHEFEKDIESFYPVTVDLKVIGWGKYRISLEPLRPMIYVSWNSNMWLLSTNGRMWLANLPANATVKGIELPKRPILAWDTGLALPIDPERQRGDIYPSSLPTAKIKKWYDSISELRWEDYIYCLIAKKVDGRPVVQILFGTEEGPKAELLVKEDTLNWASIAAAFAEIFPDEEYRLPPGVLVNATFEDMKFTVTSMDIR